MSSEFKPAESSTPRFKVHQRTFRFMDQQPVYIQVIAMENSAWIWIASTASPPPFQQQQQQQNFSQQQDQEVCIGAGAGAGAGAGSTAVGAFGDFAMAMPAFRPGQPAVSSTLLGNPLDETAASMARRLATRFKIQFLVNVDIPSAVNNAMMTAFAEKKLVETLQDILVPASGSSSSEPSSTLA